MRTCYCPYYFTTQQANENITYVNDNWYVTEEVFFMKPGCNQPNRFGFAGVCQTATLKGGEQAVFDPALYGGPMENSFFGYFPSRGVIVARIAGVMSGYVEALWANVGETLKTSDFAKYKQETGGYFGLLKTPARVWTFTVNEFRQLSLDTTHSEEGELFRRLRKYNNPQAYEERR